MDPNSQRLVGLGRCAGLAFAQDCGLGDGQMPATLVCAALQMVIVQRNPAPGLVVHSDRGTQYASSLCQALLHQHGLVGSMSRKGNCWDTQFTMIPNAAFGLTRAGIGDMPLR